jgi:hypothetical protein
MPAARPVLRAFDKGQIPTIACFNKADTALGVDFDALITALQAYVDDHVAPVWSTPAKLVKSTDFLPGAWALVFLDDADQPGALAYHDLTPDGWPLSKVFVRTTINNGDKVSVSASHELVEMLVDPAINLLSTGPHAKQVYAYESADPVEELTFDVNGIAMSDFVYPSYFEVFRKPGSTQFDHLNKVKKPFQILPGGYQIILKNGKWTEIQGSAAKKKRFAKEDRRGHRSESRGKELKRSSEKQIAQAVQRAARQAAARKPAAKPRKATGA